MSKYTYKILKTLDLKTINFNIIDKKCDIINYIFNIDYKDHKYKNLKLDLKILKKIHNNNKPLIFTQKIYNIINFKKFIDKYNNYELNFDNLNKINFKNYNITHRDKLHKMIYNSSFVSVDIQHNAETIDLKYYDIYTEGFELTLYIPLDLEFDIEINLQNIIEIIILMSNIAKQTKTYTKPKIVMFLSKQKKYFPTEQNTVLSATNINSGASITGEIIYIWRYEEYKKVLIHELIHYFMLDYGYLNNKKLDDIPYKIFNINGNNVCNESFTETLATLIYLIYISKKDNINLNILINQEINFLALQVAKIIHHFDGNNNQESFKIEIKQTTSVVSYYILKFYLMNNLQQFIDIIYKNNFKCTDNSEFIILINNIFNNNIDNIDNINNLVNKYLIQIKNNNDKKFVYRTLRMCCN